MCQGNGKHFVGSLVRRIEEKIELDSSVGRLHLGHIPPRVAVMGENEALDAMASSLSFLRQHYGIAVADEVFDQEFTPEIVANHIIVTAMEVAGKIIALKKPQAKTDFGRARIYLHVLCAVLSLFLDFFFHRHFYEKNFQQNVGRVLNCASEMALLAESVPGQSVH